MEICIDVMRILEGFNGTRMDEVDTLIDYYNELEHLNPSHPGEPETESEYGEEEANVRSERPVPMGFDHAYINAILGIVAGKHKGLYA